MKLSLIVAMDHQGGIGKDNRLPWHLPADLAHFKALTLGKPVLMGRKTWESIGRPLPERTNLVLSRTPMRLPDKVIQFYDLQTALDSQANTEELMVIGGSQLYQATLSAADVLYVTRVNTREDCDVFFPAIDPHLWRQEESIRRVADDKNPFDCTFMKFVRRG
jgi:dihydrofolate reductase